jgi:hypothetical protein
VGSPGLHCIQYQEYRLVGKGSAQKETPLDESKLMTAEECAMIILDGIEKRKRTIVMTSQGKLTVFLKSKILPGF